MSLSDPDVGTLTTTDWPAAVTYHDTYTLRREQSTMAALAVEWLGDHVRMWLGEQGESTSSLRVLSVGCGDGNMDLPLLDMLNGRLPVDYVGVDVNATSLTTFRRALNHRFDAGTVTTTLLDLPVQSLAPELGSFDLVVVSHMLYYVDQPGDTVARLLREFTRTDGRLVIIHSAFHGVPALMAAVDGLTPFLTAESIVTQLAAHHLSPTWHTLHTELDATDLLAKTPRGRAVLEFCIEADLDTLSAETQEQLQAELTARCQQRNGRWIMAEELAVLVLDNPLRHTPEAAHSVAKVDPLQDYHQLAQAFDWPERLATIPVSADGLAHVLDVGCGTGRWLRVLNATYPDLANGATRHVRYSMLDPVRPAIEAVGEVASAMFTIDRSWVDYVQQADLPNGHFGLIWAVHSLYGVPEHDLASALERMLTALHPQGTAVIVLPDASSFYITAAAELLGHTLFNSADDMRRTLDAAGVRYQVQRVVYDECIPAHDELALRHYVWMESIGNTFFPGGAHDDLPELPTGAWWESHRRDDVFAFPQCVEVITVRRSHTSGS